ncbi:AraC family transcriptional regulator [Streptomyces sp. NPDC051315]|uniref:AraC family transcriptional regulator n=1 Tax=Streptomyces sp. NPDC051315 TaxID=3365650 RepID=UPI0037B47CA1
MSAAGGTGPAARRFSFRTTDVDEARAAVDATYYATSMTLLDPAGVLDARFEVVRLGPLTVGDLSCGAPVGMRFGDLGAYHVDLPLSGRLQWSQAGRESALATPARAAVFQPEGRTSLERWHPDCRLIAVKIEARALERHLERLLGRPVRTPLRLAPELDPTSGPGATWARLARLVVAEMDNDGGLLHQPLLTAQLAESLLTGLLLATGHAYREDLDTPPAAAAPTAARPVERVLDAVHAHPERPFTTVELAAVAGVGARWLQVAFRRQLGLSPMAYVREVRLARIREELTRADPAGTTVADVAFRWGFGHLGRFAEKYRERYGELPSETLKSP